MNKAGMILRRSTLGVARSTDPAIEQMRLPTAMR